MFFPNVTCELTEYYVNRLSMNSIIFYCWQNNLKPKIDKTSTKKIKSRETLAVVSPRNNV